MEHTPDGWEHSEYSFYKTKCTMKIYMYNKAAIMLWK